MRRFTWMALGVAVLFVAACGDDDDATPTATTRGEVETTRPAVPTSSSGGATASSTSGPGGLEEAPLIVESASVSGGATPVLDIRGQLPTPCHQPTSEVVAGTGTIDVRVFSLVDPEAMCAQVVEPFTLSVPLGALPAETATVLLNGEAVGTIG
ncbi:MAG: hypothetical protein GEV08_25780 [Acidimicrobiia bacterium]|nr:hypothetical protein [Acidimicrobiia bacterium]